MENDIIEAPVEDTLEVSQHVADADVQQMYAQQAEMRRNAALNYAATIEHSDIDSLVRDAQTLYHYLADGSIPLDEG